MRKRIARQATDAAAKSGQRGALLAARALACLVGLLLVLQFNALPRQYVGAGPHPSAKAAALASLAAAIGQAAPLCEHGDAPAGDNNGPAGCQHCIFCHSIPAGFPPAFGAPIPVDRVASSADVARPREPVAIARPRLGGSATPRGPPRLG